MEDWENMTFEKMTVKDLINIFDHTDPKSRIKLEELLKSMVLELDKKSDEELKIILTNLAKQRDEIKIIPNNPSFGHKKIQFFLGFLSDYISEIEKRINKM